MNAISILTGLMAGFAIAAVIFYLLGKIKNVSKASYETLATRYNETTTLLKVSEDRMFNLQQEYIKLGSKMEARETELSALQGVLSSRETTIKNDEQKIAELAVSVAEKTALGSAQQNEINSLKQVFAEVNATNKSLSANLDLQKETSHKQSEQIGQLMEKLNVLSSENSALTAQHAAVTEKLSVQKEEIAGMQKTAHLQFEKIANQIFEEKSGRFTETNKSKHQSAAETTWRENIDTFKKKVEETYDKESKQRFSLEERVKELVEQTNKVSNEANNLATALKGQAKKQGNWGEMILESILQKSGLVKDREYFLQKNITDDEGKNLRPDVLIHLPDNRVIIIDSKSVPGFLRPVFIRRQGRRTDHSSRRTFKIDLRTY